MIPRVRKFALAESNCWGIYLGMTQATKEPVPAVKQPRHINIAMTHMLKQRQKAIVIRDKAADEVKKLDEALLALGWGEES